MENEHGTDNEALALEELLVALRQAPDSCDRIMALSGKVTAALALANHARGQIETALRMYKHLGQGQQLAKGSDALWYVAADAARDVGNQKLAIKFLEHAQVAGLPGAQARLDKAVADNITAGADDVTVQDALMGGKRVIAVLAKTPVKGGKRKDVRVEIDADGASVLIRFHDGSEFHRRFEYLIVVADSSYIETDYKVELTLILRAPGPRANIVREVSRPENPYAFRPKAIEDEPEEKRDGAAGLQELFQQMYADSDDDTKRAMMKSYQTSGGTCLSTSWAEVRNRDYEQELKPPDGQEVRRWT